MLKKLKSLFIVEDEKSKSSSPASKSKPVKAAAGTNKSTSNPATKSSSISVTSNAGASKDLTDKFMNVLLGAMDKNNLDGFDYLEYKQSLQSLGKIEVDEEKRFKSAFVMAQTMNATQTHLIDTAKHYINILKKEEAKFQQALINQKSKQISDKEERIKMLEQSINDKKKQIEKLNSEIQKNTDELSKAKSSINQAADKLETTKKSFTSSYNNLIGQINDDIQKMTTYLK